MVSAQLAQAQPLRLCHQSQQGLSQGGDCSQEGPGSCACPSSSRQPAGAHHPVHSRERSSTATTCPDTLLQGLSWVPQETLSPPPCGWQAPGRVGIKVAQGWVRHPCGHCRAQLVGSSSGGKAEGVELSLTQAGGLGACKTLLRAPSFCHCPSPGDGSWSYSHGRHHGAQTPAPLHHAGKQTFPSPTQRRWPMVVGGSLCQPLRGHICFPAGHRPILLQPQEGMTGVEPAGPVPQVCSQAGAGGWKGSDMQPKLCHYQPQAVPSCPLCCA